MRGNRFRSEHHHHHHQNRNHTRRPPPHQNHQQPRPPPNVYQPSTFFISLAAPSNYIDRNYPGGRDAYIADMKTSTTLYVGNLSFYTTEEQIYELFSKVGEIKRIIMGLDKGARTPCGFCFVEYYLHEDALSCLKFINGTKLDERVIRTDLDPGFKDGRQYGRGRSGGQVRDEHRADYDEGRGGWGHRQKLIQEEEDRKKEQKESYEAIEEVPAGGEQYESGANGTERKRGTEDMDDSDVAVKKRKD